MQYPSKFLKNAIYEISNLPGIGTRTAFRLALHLLKGPKEKGKSLSHALSQMMDYIKNCTLCHNLSDEDLCHICKDRSHRETNLLCLVEDIRDIMAIEETFQYKGLYHVLGGKISPMEGIGANDLTIKSFLDRIKKEDISEIIFALSSTIEADVTISYINKEMENFQGKVSILSRGLSMDEELEYVDKLTLGKSILNRIPYH